jgi:hypothetical protein
MKLRTVRRTVLALVACAITASAEAPQSQYERFDQNSFEINDSATHLYWDRRRVQKFTQAEASLYCSSLIFVDVGRLPTVKELLTLVDEDPHEEYDVRHSPPLVRKAIDPLAFPNTPTDEAYWTRTPAPGNRFWTVDFTTGTTSPRDPASKLNARCVK